MCRQSIQYFKPKTIAEKNKKYTVEELIRIMIKYSDNYAALLLSSNPDLTKAVDRIFNDLGVTFSFKPEESISVKSYASLFRVLFNASYLNKENSEKTLSLLSKTEFSQGIVAGLPKNIISSHKFGEYLYPENKIKQLHDCGIVYYPNHPYLICIMSRGDNFDDLAKTIKNISSLVYQEIDNQYK